MGFLTLDRSESNMAPNPTVHNGSVKIDISRTQDTAVPNKADTTEVESLPTERRTRPRVEHLKFLCFPLERFPRSVQFFLCCAGIFFFFLIYGYMQELMFRLEGFKPYGWYLTLMQCSYYTVFGLTQKVFRERLDRKIPLKTYALISFLTMATVGLSNASVGYLNFPTHCIFKCCQLIPVMIGGVIIQGKSYGVLDVIACLAMTVGIVFFTLADVTVSPNFNLYGVTLISLALCADAIIGNVQEKVMNKHDSSNSEMILYSYGIGIFFVLFMEIVSGQLIPAFKFCLKYPVRTYGYAFVYSLVGYLGVNVILTLVKSFGALIATTVTTSRKAMTIVLSFVFFSKPFTFQYVWSGMIVLFGIALNVYNKNKSLWSKNSKETDDSTETSPKT